MDWMRTTWRSFIGYFGFLEHPLGLDIYEIHKKIFALGLPRESGCTPASPCSTMSGRA